MNTKLSHIVTRVSSDFVNEMQTSGDCRSLPSSYECTFLEFRGNNQYAFWTYVIK